MNFSQHPTFEPLDVAAVRMDASGHVGAQAVASIENNPDHIVLCCEGNAPGNVEIGGAALLALSR